MATHREQRDLGAGVRQRQHAEVAVLEAVEGGGQQLRAARLVLLVHAEQRHAEHAVDPLLDDLHRLA